MSYCFSAGRLPVLLALSLALGAAAVPNASAATNKVAASPTQPAATTPAPPPQAAPVEPGMTTADFGDWVLRCQPIKSGTETRKLCEVGESIQVQGQSNPIARVAIGRLNKGDPLRVTVLLPNNITLPSAVRVGPASPDTSNVELAWRRCLPGACVADAEMKDDILKVWRVAADGGRIAFKDASGRDVTVPVSFKGLALALDALAKEPREL